MFLGLFLLRNNPAANYAARRIRRCHDGSPLVLQFSTPPIGTYIVQAIPSSSCVNDPNHPVSGSDFGHLTIAVPAISLTKTANPTTYNAVGQTITYTYVIKNTGNVTLPGPFTVTDDKVTTVTCAAGPLAPGATLNCTGTYAITQAELNAGSVTNTATASTTYNGNPVNSN